MKKKQVAAKDVEPGTEMWFAGRWYLIHTVTQDQPDLHGKVYFTFLHWSSPYRRDSPIILPRDQGVYVK